MPIIASRRKSALAQNQQETLNRFLSLRPSQQERLQELSVLFHQAKDQDEREEIIGVFAEIFFGREGAVKGSPIDEEETTEAAQNAVRTHRRYVAKQIKRLRQTAKMSQVALANKAGLPQSHICRLENGQHAPTYLTIEKLANAIGVRMSDIDPSYDD